MGVAVGCGWAQVELLLRASFFPVHGVFVWRWSGWVVLWGELLLKGLRQLIDWETLRWLS